MCNNVLKPRNATRYFFTLCFHGSVVFSSTFFHSQFFRLCLWSCQGARSLTQHFEFIFEVMVFSFTFEVDLTSSLDFGSLYVFEFICISGSWLLVFVLSLCLSCESLPCPLCLFALFIPSLSHISFLFVSPLPVSLFLLNLSCLCYFPFYFVILVSCALCPVLLPLSCYAWFVPPVFSCISTFHACLLMCICCVCSPLSLARSSVCLHPPCSLCASLRFSD